MALAKKPLEIFQQVTVKNAEGLAGVSAMFVVVRAKWNASHHIRRPFRQNDALRFLSWHLRLLHSEADVPRGCGASPQATSAASRPAPLAMTKGQGNRRRSTSNASDKVTTPVRCHLNSAGCCVHGDRAKREASDPFTHRMVAVTRKTAKKIEKSASRGVR
jgi:hypothetical protein